jgi:WG containing repeat
MTVHRLMVVAVALLFACAPVVAGCDSADTVVTTETVQLYPVSIDGRWGFIDNTGTIKIEPLPDIEGVGYSGFSEGLARVRATENHHTKWGYIDTSGAAVIEPQFDGAGDFSEGLAAVGMSLYESGEDWLHGYIDTSGTLVIPLQYERVGSFHDGLALIYKGGQQFFIDKTGATVLGPYDFAYGFSEGLAYVDEGERRGFIDTNGEWVAELGSAMRDLWASGSYVPATGFSEGLMVLQATSEMSANKGYVDKTGAWVIQPQFIGARDFSEGLAAAAVGESDALKWGYVDKTGAWVIQPQFDHAYDFSEGQAAVQVAGDGSIKAGYIDKTGTVVIPVQYEWAGDFSGGIAQVTTADSFGSPSYIDKTGQVIWHEE